MAELLGGVASGFAVASLADQIYTRVQQLHNLWKAIENAPKDIEDVLRHLQLLSTALQNLKEGFCKHGLEKSELLSDCSRHCEGVIEELGTIAARFEFGRSGTGAKRKTTWAQVKAAFKKEDIKTLQEKLGRAVATLELAISCANILITQAAHNKQNDIHALVETIHTILQQQNTQNHQSNQSIDITMSTTTILPLYSPPPAYSPMATPSPRRSSIEKLKTTEINPYSSPQRPMRVSSRWSLELPKVCAYYLVKQQKAGSEYLKEDLEAEPSSHIADEEIITRKLYLSKWLSSKSYEYIATRKNCNWQYVFKTARVLESDHPIWDACENGDIQQMVGLFRKERLSINDTDEMGRTLLHWTNDAKTCQWLVQQGIDYAAQDRNGESALYMNSLWRYNDGKADIDHQEKLLNRMRFLVEQCNLDPTDVASTSRLPTILLGGFRSIDVFNYLFTNAQQYMEVNSTLVKDILRTAASIDQTSSQMLHDLIEYVNVHGLVEPGYTGRMWMYGTDDMMETAIKRVRNQQINFGCTNPINFIPEETRRICQGIIGGADLHRDWRFEWLLDYQHCVLGEWMACLHKSKKSLRGYFEKEAALRPDGRLREKWFHFRQEYPMYDIQYSKDPSDVTVQVRVAIVQPETRRNSTPGEWTEDVEQAYCDERRMWLQERQEEPKSYALQIVGRGDPRNFRGEWSGDALEGNVVLMSNHGPDFPAHYYEPVDEVRFEDGRTAKVYILQEWSTKAFAEGDYEVGNMLMFERDLDKFPLWVDYGDRKAKKIVVVQSVAVHKFV